MELEFSRKIFEKLKHQISWKSVQWEPSCSMRTDRQTDRQTWRILRCITAKTQLYYHTVIKFYISVHIKATCFGRNSAIIRPIQNI